MAFKCILSHIKIYILSYISFFFFFASCFAPKSMASVQSIAHHYPNELSIYFILESSK